MSGVRALGRPATGSCLGALLLGAAMPLAADGIAITGARVHTLAAAGTVEDAVVLVSDGRVEAVGRGLAVPPDYAEVKAAGRVITPGLIESRSQFGLLEVGGETTTTDGILLEYPSGPSFDVRHALNDASVAIAVNRRDGVTRAIVAPAAGNDPLAGMGVAVRLVPGELLTATDVGLFGTVGAGSAAFVGGSRSAVIQRLRRGLTLARTYHPNRYHPGAGDYSHQDMAALKRFLGADMPLVLEVHRAAEIRAVLALAVDFRLELVIVGGTEAWKLADRLALAEVPVVVNVLANLPVSYDRLGARLDNAALLEAAGVPVLFTAGSTLNARLLRQMAGNAVAYGMSSEGALAAMTRLPGQVWQFAEATGTLAPGAPADLVIWSGDPLELTSWAEQVMIDGVWQDMSSRQQKLFERYRNPTDPDRYYR